MKTVPRFSFSVLGRSFKLGFLVVLAGVVAALFLYLTFLLLYQDLIFPGVKISNIDIGGQSPAQAKQTVARQFQSRAQSPLQFTVSGQKISLELKETGPYLNLDQLINSAYLIGRSDNLIGDFQEQVKALTSGVNLVPKLKFNNAAILKAKISQLGQEVKKETVNAQITLGDPVTITPSQDGQILDEQLFLSQVSSYLSLSEPKPLFLPLKTVQPNLTTERAQKYKQALTAVKETPVKLHYQQQAVSLDQNVLFSLLDLEGKPATDSAQKEEGSLLDQTKLADWLKELSDQINRPARDARFTFDSNSKRVQQFQAAQEGRELDINQTALLINEALAQNTDREIELPVNITQPKITTDSVNSFGIRQLLGQGVSHFSGSIDNRIFNIRLAASRLNGTLIPPGETFSFNNTVGDISAQTGYKQAYVIKSGRTVLDDGGGVCQVSTTLFRAVLNSGLPVKERTAHAYRVGYYEQGFPPGLDATVFAPSVDFKFNNDTPAHLLIQAYTWGNTLYVDIYGSDDGRITSLTTPKILSQTPPLPEIRQDDPSLPKGTIKQVDWPAWGANVLFDRTVRRNGEAIIQETWRSNYRPWQAVYLVGTKE